MKKNKTTITTEDQHEVLKNTSKEKLLGAAILFYEKYNPGCGKWMKLGFQLNGDNSWKYVAPAWLENKNNIYEKKQN